MVDTPKTPEEYLNNIIELSGNAHTAFIGFTGAYQLGRELREPVIGTAIVYNYCLDFTRAFENILRLIQATYADKMQVFDYKQYRYNIIDVFTINEWLRRNSETYVNNISVAFNFIQIPDNKTWKDFYTDLQDTSELVVDNFQSLSYIS